MTTSMDTGRNRLVLVEEAIDIVLRRLEVLRPSPDVVALRAAALRQLREAQGWEKHRPSLEAQEKVMKRVLGLHLGAAKLGRT